MKLRFHLFFCARFTIQNYKMQYLFIILIILLGAVGYTFMIKDIKNPNRNNQELINRPYYWCLLFFIGGITTISIGVLSEIFHLPADSKWSVIILGSILMILYTITFLFLPRKYFISKYKK